MPDRMFDARSVVSLVLVIINTYVLVFSSLPFLYRIFIVVFSFILLLLVSLALQGLERLEKPELE